MRVPAGAYFYNSVRCLASMRLLRFLACVFPLVVITALTFLGLWYFSPHLPEYVIRRAETFADRKVSFLIVDLTEARYRFDLKKNEERPLSVQMWRDALAADIVFNGAYFGEGNEPSGYFKVNDEPSVQPWPSREEQKEKVSYAFLVEVNDGALQLSYLPENPQEEPAGDAFLSFPTLVVNGRPIVKADSLQYGARTILAEGDNGHIYLVLTERGSVSLYEAAEWLAAQPEHFTLAGNLDGGPSTGVSLENGFFDLEDASAQIPNVLAGYRDRE
jgi:hypothetical protein